VCALIAWLLRMRGGDWYEAVLSLE
jgi:hypothetical protein